MASASGAFAVLTGLAYVEAVRLEGAKAVFVPHAVQSTLVIFRNKQVDKIEDVKEWVSAFEKRGGK